MQLEPKKIFPAGGYPNVVTVSRFHNENPLLQIRSIALVDGDIYNPAADPLPDHARFIGEGCPEAIVFDYIYDNRRDIVSLVRQRCFLSQFTEDRIITAIEGVRNSACDPHVIFTSMSERLDFVSAIYVRAGMIDLFNERNPDFWVEIVTAVAEIAIP